MTPTPAPAPALPSVEKIRATLFSAGNKGSDIPLQWRNAPESLRRRYVDGSHAVLALFTPTFDILTAECAVMREALEAANNCDLPDGVEAQVVAALAPSAAADFLAEKRAAETRAARAHADALRAAALARVEGREG